MRREHVLNKHQITYVLDLPSEVKAAAIDVSTQQVSTCANKALDKSVDSCFANDSSWGSRVVNYFKS